MIFLNAVQTLANFYKSHKSAQESNNFEKATDEFRRFN